MKISQIYIYPIKSLRGVPVSSAEATRTGFKYDRRFMLLKVVPADGGPEGETGATTTTATTTLKNMHVPHFPEMALFQTELFQPGQDPEGWKEGRVRVTFKGEGKSTSSNASVDENGNGNEIANGHGAATKGVGLGGTTIDIPLTPDIRGLEELAVIMHKSPTKGYNMGERYNAWFSERFGYDVVLAYLSEENWRSVLGTFAPAKHFAHKAYFEQRSPVGAVIILGFVAVAVLAVGLRIELFASNKPVQLLSGGAIAMLALLGLFHFRTEGKHNERITFADAAPYMVVSETSVANVSDRLEGQEVMDVRKFRANVIVDGARTAFEEDFWGELILGESDKPTAKGSSGVRLLLTANCVRCRSLDVDYTTGKMGDGESGKVLKKLMSDRRVDLGAKYSPVFGRYGFLDAASNSRTVRVGDEVVVARRMQERSVYDWPGLA